ncbi:MAG: hypothetical protein ABW364_16990, partial [Rhodococcus fascians]
AIGRASDTGDFLADLGRRQARSEGWYDTRRSMQAAVVGIIAGIWAIVAIVAIWRVPTRRRRYLPTALIVFTIICFAGVRIISLHQIDAALRIDTIGELTTKATVEVSLLLSCAMVSLALILSPRSKSESGLSPARREARPR